MARVSRTAAEALDSLAMATTLLEVFAEGRRSGGDASPLLETPAGLRLSYPEADTAAAAMGGALRAAGVGAGDRVAAAVHKSPEGLLLYLGALRIGAVLLPLNPAYTDPELDYIFADAEPSLIVADPSRVRSPAAGGAVWHTLDAGGAGSFPEAAAAAPAVEQEDVAPTDPAVLLYTSGTTGRPKGALLSHSNLASNAATLRDAWGFGPEDRLLHALPVYHAHGLLVGVNVTLASGTGMWWLDRFDPGAVIEGMRHSTVFMGVPTHYTRLLADPGLDREACARMRLFVSGSAPLAAATHAQWESRTGHRILERYGMTETVMIASNPLTGERRPGTVGPPLPGVEVRIVEGEVEVRGPNVFSGYWRRPERRDEDFAPGGWFRTGDLGELDGDGYLRLAGRAKDLVISGGLNVYPKEVEAVLDSLEGVAESAVVGMPDADFGEAVTAVVVPQPGAEVDPTALRLAARERLAGYKVPKAIHVVDELPRNAMGKVEKEKIRRSLAVIDGAQRGGI